MEETHRQRRIYILQILPRGIYLQLNDILVLSKLMTGFYRFEDMRMVEMIPSVRGKLVIIYRKNEQSPNTAGVFKKQTDLVFSVEKYFRNESFHFSSVRFFLFLKFPMTRRLFCRPVSTLIITNVLASPRSRNQKWFVRILFYAMFYYTLFRSFWTHSYTPIAKNRNFWTKLGFLTSGLHFSQKLSIFPFNWWKLAFLKTLQKNDKKVTDSPKKPRKVNFFLKQSKITTKIGKNFQFLLIDFSVSLFSSFCVQIFLHYPSFPAVRKCVVVSKTLRLEHVVWWSPDLRNTEKGI